MASAARSAAKARERRSRMLAIVLGVLFLAVAAIQGPKLLKSLSGSKASTAAPVVVATTSGLSLAAQPVAGGTTSLIAQPVAPPPAAGQLATFSSFAPKDPFHAQINPAAIGAAGGSAGGGTTSPAGAGSHGASSQGAAQKSSVTPGKPLSFTVKPAGVTPGTSLPSVPAALLHLNGAKTVVALGDTFPAKKPVFQLVALESKFIVLKLIGGSFSNGKQTLRIQAGHPMTLANVTDSARFVIDLVGPTTTHPRPTAPGLPAKAG